MQKTEVYSWRVDAELKSALEVAARAERMSVSKLLDRIATEWLRREGDATDPEKERRIRAQAMRYVGSIRGKDPARAREASRRVSSLLHRKHARHRAD